MPIKRRKVRRIAIVPTLLTLANGVCGFLAITQIGEGRTESLVTAAQLILLAMIFDALDGAVARLAHVAGNFGAQLDSLCDLVTFGAAPAYLAMRVVGIANDAYLPPQILVILAAFYFACAAVRLARFNVETSPEESSHQSFAGLPSPAAAGVLATLIWVWGQPADTMMGRLVTEIHHGVPFLLLVLGVLMISRVRYEHMVSRFIRGTHPFVRLVEVLLAIVCLAALRQYALGLGFGIYMISGPVLHVKHRLLRPDVEPEAPLAEEDFF
jgi:CDP-diacylglycerol--serine O-phosphatidyltransferase